MPNTTGLVGTLLGFLGGIATGIVIYKWIGGGLVAVVAGVVGGLLGTVLWGALAIFLIQVIQWLMGRWRSAD